MKTLLLSICVTGCLDNASLATPPAAQFMGLGIGTGSGVLKTSTDGSVVAGTLSSAAGYDAFRWTQSTGVTVLGTLNPNSHSSTAFGISGDGSVVVGRAAENPYGICGFRWTSSTGMQCLAPTNNYSAAFGISRDGSTVVGISDANLAFRWTAATGLVNIGDLPGGTAYSSATSVSADGSVIAGDGTLAGGFLEDEAFRWTSATGLVDLGRAHTQPRAISDDGSVIVGIQNQAFRWTQQSGFVSLGVLPGYEQESKAFDVSADGSVVVGSSQGPLDNKAFIWDAVHGMRSLTEIATGLGIDLTGWSLRTAYGISADGGTIVGEGLDPEGFSEGWRIVLPEPTSFSLFGIIALLHLRRRQVRIASRT